MCLNVSLSLALIALCSPIVRYRTVRYHSIPWRPAPANLQSFPRRLQAIDPLTRTSNLQSFIRRAPDENRRASFFFTHPSRLVQRLPTNSRPSPSHKAFVGGFVNSPHHIFLRLGPFLCSTASCLCWALSVNSLVHALSPPRVSCPPSYAQRRDSHVRGFEPLPTSKDGEASLVTRTSR